MACGRRGVEVWKVCRQVARPELLADGSQLPDHIRRRARLDNSDPPVLPESVELFGAPLSKRRPVRNEGYEEEIGLERIVGDMRILRVGQTGEEDVCEVEPTRARPVDACIGQARPRIRLLAVLQPLLQPLAKGPFEHRLSALPAEEFLEQMIRIDVHLGPTWEWGISGPPRALVL